MNAKLLIWILCVLLIGIRFADPIPVELARVSLFDFYQRIAPRAPDPLPVTIIDIDENSLQEFGQWPWARSRLGKLVDKLMEHFPTVIGFDFVFPEHDRMGPEKLKEVWGYEEGQVELGAVLDSIPDQDLVFAQSLTGQPVVLGRMLQKSRGNQRINSDPEVTAEVVFSGENPLPFIPPSDFAVVNIPELRGQAQGLGVLTLLPEQDGIVRRVPTLHRVGDKILPSLGIEMLRLGLFADKIEVFADNAGIDRVNVGGIDIPTDRNGLTWVYFNRRTTDRYISASDILNDRLEPGALAGHLMQKYIDLLCDD